MAGDIVAELGHLFLGTRLKRLAERMQADVLKVAAGAGLPIQPSQYPLLAVIEREGSMTVGQIAETLSISQPGSRAISPSWWSSAWSRRRGKGGTSGRNRCR